jgi:endoglucanase
MRTLVYLEARMSPPDSSSGRVTGAAPAADGDSPNSRSVRSWLRYNARAIALIVGCALTTGLVVAHAVQGTEDDLLMRVSGNELVDAGGEPVQLRGVNRSGAEFACVQGKGIFDGPTDAASVAAMREWNINAVRVPLNTHCWLGNEDVPARFRGAPYRLAVTNYVATLNDAGMVAILDLHWTAPRHLAADRQRIMPDADHAISFWSSVAETFAATPGVLFDLYNEPHDVDWSCWRDGCTTPGGWRAVGMQELVDAVRQAGASQPVLLGGLGWANDLSGWLAHRPSDPSAQVVAAFHVYPHMSCRDIDCWDREIAPVARVVPVVTGEVGGAGNCERSEFVETYTGWADDHRISWLAWTWNAWNCETNLPLIRSYDGEPTAYGRAVREALAGRRDRSPTPRPSRRGDRLKGRRLRARGSTFGMKHLPNDSPPQRPALSTPRRMLDEAAAS